MGESTDAELAVVKVQVQVVLLRVRLRYDGIWGYKAYMSFGVEQIGRRRRGGEVEGLLDLLEVWAC